MLSMGSATPGYLPAIGARLRRKAGTSLTATSAAWPPVAVISESVARALTAGRLIGRQLPSHCRAPRDRGPPTVIGVVSDIKYAGWSPRQAGDLRHVEVASRPARRSWRFDAGDQPRSTTALRGIVRERDPRMPLMPVRSLEEVVERSVADRRLNALLGGERRAARVRGGDGRVVRQPDAYRVRAARGTGDPRRARRKPGARRPDDRPRGDLLAASAWRWAAWQRSRWGGRSQRSCTASVRTIPATLAGVAAFVGAASLLASYIPARRAARIDPLMLLRAE